MTPDEYCQSKAAPNGSGFYYAVLFSAPAQRRALIALRAFCLELDKVVAEMRDPGVARTRLGWWHEQITLMYLGKTEHPVMQALAPHLDAYPIRASSLHTLVESAEMDLNQFRYPDWETLKHYCEQSAGVATELAAAILGFPDNASRDYPRQLGVALQLTRFIRDVGLDARHGRIYLPLEDLQQFGVSEAELLDRRHSERVAALIEFQAQRARQYYQQATQALPDTARRKQAPCLAMAAIAYALLDEIGGDQWQVLDQRTSLTPVRKFWLAWKTRVTGGRGLLRRLRG